MDLKRQIEAEINSMQITAGWIISAVGSLRAINIRFANQREGYKQLGFFEILSLSGTVSIHGTHLHICVADENGKTMGGHLLEANVIYTTAELVIGYDEALTFSRTVDNNTGFKELVIDLSK
jgi:predicted DNA-binding protein with PD1-like motif